MLSKIFKHLGIILLALSASQCLSICQAPSFVYDTTNLGLQWQATSKPLELAGINLSEVAEGKVCYVPAHKATYLIDLQGNTWQFSHNTEGNLVVKEIAKLATTFRPQEAFVFAAGNEKQQALFIGKISPQGMIQLWKYDTNTWQKLPQSSQYIADFFSHTAALGFTSPLMAACSWQADEQLCGCVIVALQQGKGFSNGILVFDSRSEQFKALQPTLASIPNVAPRVAISPEPYKLLLQMPQAYANAKFALINLTNQQANFRGNIIGDTDNYQVLNAFSLKLEAKHTVTAPIFYAFKNASYSFLKLDAYNNFTTAGAPPASLAKNKALIVPFDKEVYGITEEATKGGKAQTVYYQAKLERGQP
jgi:hypothetical protein